jgi:hypothetical protein
MTINWLVLAVMIFCLAVIAISFIAIYFNNKIETFCKDIDEDLED